jgi:hypothetical protein
VKFNCSILKQVLHSNTLWSTTRTPEQPPLITRTPERPPKSKQIKSKEDLIDQYPNCFSGIGKFEGEYHITTDLSVPPVIHPPRRVPISLKDDIKKALDEMVANGIITKINEGEPTRWVNSLVYKRKQNGRLRLCLDPKDLNTAMVKEHHAIPTLEDILPKLHKAKFFSIVDAKCGYWNVVLDEESNYLATFNSPFGRYKYLISEEVALTYFDPEKETVLQVYASTKGLGATLLQEDKPVAFSSKAYVESRQANIERELLAVVYRCEKFHT